MHHESAAPLFPSLLAALLLAACSGLEITEPEPRPGVDLDVTNDHPANLSIIATRQNFPVRSWRVPPETDALIAVRTQPWADRLTDGPVQFLLSSARDQRIVKSARLDLEADDVVEIVVPEDLQQATVEIRDD